MKILISRVDSIGDVVLTLPLCGWIKQNLPHCEVHFLCQQMTVDVIRMSEFVDHIHVWDGVLPEVDAILHIFPKKEIAIAAKKQRIATRVGTSHRSIHWRTCNKLVHFSRTKSDLHEAQLNFRLLEGLDVDHTPTLSELPSLIGWRAKKNHSEFLSDKFDLVFHIKSRGSAKEWKPSNYLEVAKQLSADDFNIILTGTRAEGALIREEVPEIFDLENVTDSTGKLSLGELIDLLASVEGFLACSTGPLHLAAVSGTNALGLYPKTRPMHAGRWGPLGSNSAYLEEKTASKLRYLNIEPALVKEKIESWVA